MNIYRSSRGPAYDEDCQCHCMEERNTFHQALENINEIVGDKHLDKLVDQDIDAIRNELSVR